MKTVVQVVQHLAPGGIETMALDLLQVKLKEERVLVVSLEGNEFEAFESWPVLKPFKDQIIFLNKPPGFKLRYVWKLARLLKKLKTDVVHTHHIGPLIYGGLAAKLARVKRVIHTEHDAWHLNDPQRRQLQQRMLKIVKPVLVADAKHVSAHIRESLQRSPDKLILNGVNTNKFQPGNKNQARQVFDLPVDAVLIGTSGRLEPVKGQEFLIDAMISLPSYYHLVIAGVGSLEQKLKQQVRDLHLANRVHFLGLVTDMPSFYQSLDLFCLPSLKEGFPLSALEAQSCGVRAVVTNAGGASETVCPSTGFVVDVECRKALVDGITDAMKVSNPQSPRDFVVANASLKTMAISYAALRKESYGS
jgi:glycosyltransferase involved in cell wall biosynthesis